MELEQTRGLISSRENDKERTYYLSTPFHRHPPLEEYSVRDTYALVKETEKRGSYPIFV